MPFPIAWFGPCVTWPSRTIPVRVPKLVKGYYDTLTHSMTGLYMRLPIHEDGLLSPAQHHFTSEPPASDSLKSTLGGTTR